MFKSLKLPVGKEQVENKLENREWFEQVLPHSHPYTCGGAKPKPDSLVGVYCCQ